MKVLPNTNFWIALTLENHPGHALATAWQATSPLGRNSMIFCRHTEFSFLRLTTRESTMLAFGRKPFSNSDATRFLASVQAHPLVTELAEASGTKELWFKLAASGAAAPNVWMDAYLAAFAIRHGLDLLTFDKGFRKFAKAGLVLRLF